MEVSTEGKQTSLDKLFFFWHAHAHEKKSSTRAVDSADETRKFSKFAGGHHVD